jgi:hypothetical protein
MSEKEKNKERLDNNLRDANAEKEAFAERAWIKGTKTAMEKDILAAGRQKKDKPKE